MADERVEPKLRMLRILFVAMLLSIGIYSVIATVIVRTRDPAFPIPQPELAAAPLSQPLFFALAGMALVLLAATPLARMKLMPPRSYGHGGGSVSGALQRLFVAEIVSWALCEVIAVFGLVLTMLSYEPTFTYAFGAVAAVAMLAYAPSRKLVDDVVRVASAVTPQ